MLPYNVQVKKNISGARLPLVSVGTLFASSLLHPANSIFLSHKISTSQLAVFFSHKKINTSHQPTEHSEYLCCDQSLLSLWLNIVLSAPKTNCFAVSQWTTPLAAVCNSAQSSENMALTCKREEIGLSDSPDLSCTIDVALLTRYWSYSYLVPFT